MPLRALKRKPWDSKKELAALSKASQAALDDEGVWVRPETVVEAYLIERLHELLNAVELYTTGEKLDAIKSKDDQGQDT